MSDEQRNGNCAAHGCPMPGTTNTSTSGGSDWMCGLHFGKDAVQWQPITVELNRVRWLVDAIQAIRRYRLKECWEGVYRNIQQEIRLNQRSDLLRTKTENAIEWANRLDGELRKIALGEAPVSMPMMEALGMPSGPAVDPGASDTWKKAEFEVPA